MQCDRCAGDQFTKAGRDRQRRQLYPCRACGRRITTRSGSAFRGYRFPDEVIALAVRYSLRSRLSYQDVVEWRAERGLLVDASTIDDWVRAFTPHCIAAARAVRSQVGRHGRVDETYITSAKRWHSRYRAIDAQGQIVDGYLSDRRDRAAVQAFCAGALETGTVSPRRVTTAKAKCYPSALHAVLPDSEHRTSKYLNNRLERDHQQLQGRIRPMRWFTTVGGASTFSRGHALIRNLGCGFASLTAQVPVRLRLATERSARAASL